MVWDGRDTIALVELIFYTPFLILSVLVCHRHGFGRSSGWYYTLALCLVRIIGAICQFVSHNDRSIELSQTILILDSLGLAPLLLGTLGLLSRYIGFINVKSTPRLTKWHLRLLHLLLLVSTIIAIVGGSNVRVDSNGTYQTPTTSKVGVTLYVVGFVAIVLVYLLSLSRISVVPSGERREPIALALALPAILTRLIYSILSVFLHDHLFSVATGSAAVRFGMAVVEEFIVVGIYVVLGLLVDKMDPSTKSRVASPTRHAYKRGAGARQGVPNVRFDIEA